MTTFKPIGGAKVLVASTGQAVQFPVGIRINRVDIQALAANAGSVVIGDSGVTTDLANGGISLSAGDVYNVELVSDMSFIYVNGTSGDGVQILYWVGDRN